MVEDSSLQRISRLTPLKAVLDLIDARVAAVAPRRGSLAQAAGATLAADVVPLPLPAAPIALRDGIAVDAAAVADANSYAPAPLDTASRRVDVGDPMPDGTNAVLPLDAVVLRGGHSEALVPIAAGEGVLAAGADATAETLLRRAGERLRAIDVALMTAAGMTAALFRAPRVTVACGSAGTSPPIQAALAILAAAVTAAGGEVVEGSREPGGLDVALADSRADAIIAVGGTGSGRRDNAVATLGRRGQVAMHGIAVSPGESAAFGFAGQKPVLLIPGRLDAALALWLLIGRHLVAKLAEGHVADSPATMPLKRKVTSTIGFTELVPVSSAGGMAEPLAAGYLSLAALARSDGWIIVPADSEGFMERTPVAVRPWP
jgi:molybdopterin molybdotransferase